MLVLGSYHDAVDQSRLALTLTNQRIVGVSRTTAHEQVDMVSIIRRFHRNSEEEKSGGARRYQPCYPTSDVGHVYDHGFEDGCFGRKLEMYLRSAPKNLVFPLDHFPNLRRSFMSC